jgi:phosphomannomutase/phosphoglucomutase
MFFADRYFGYDDAIYSACRLVEMLGKSSKKVSDYFSDLPKVISTPEIRADCPDDKKFALAEKAVDYFIKLGYDVTAIDGVRINLPDGWGLLRASNTQPVVVMRFEANTKERLEEIRNLIEGKFKEWVKE